MSNEDDIVVVQGSSVPAASSGGGDGGGGHGRGEKQETRCRDPIFAVLFYVMLISITAVAIILGPDAFNTESTDENANDEGDVDGEKADYSGVAKLALIAFVISLVTAPICLNICMRFAKSIIKFGLIFTAVSFFLMGVASLFVNIIGAIVNFFFFLIMCCYIRAVWRRIPFASANLNTASAAVLRNWGVIVYAFVLSVASGVFTLVWVIAESGVYHETYNCTDEECKDPSAVGGFFLFLAFIFGEQVFQNTIHVVTAGAVGTWWFAPEDASSCCSSAVNDSFLRATTTSFGSICFGSLLVAILRTLEEMARQANRDGEGGFLSCLAACILGCLGDLLEYFNKWAYIYVGLYGYSYIEAGKNVMQLFKSRGWEAIIADDLVDYVVFFISALNGLVMGLVGWGLGSSSLLEDVEGNTGLIGFIVGLLIGFIVCAVIMNVVSSGVNAVIVLFAEAPAEFAENYPALSQEMISTWTEIYPDINVGRY